MDGVLAWIFGEKQQEKEVSRILGVRMTDKNFYIVSLQHKHSVLKLKLKLASMAEHTFNEWLR